MKRLEFFLRKSLLAGIFYLVSVCVAAQELDPKFYIPQIEEFKEQETIVIGIAVPEISDIESGLLNGTFKALQRKLPQYKFESTILNEHDIFLSAINKSIDFYVASSGTFAYMQDSSGATYLASNRNPGITDPQHAAGALVVARADDKRLKNLTDLRNKRVATRGRESFFGMQVVLNELRRSTERPDQYFDIKTVHLGSLEIVKKVLTNKVDAGILKTCELEYLYEHNLIAKDSLKPVGLTRQRSIECMASTPLYPDFVFAANPHVSAQLNSEVAEVLLSMSKTEKGYQWVIANDFRDVIHVIRRFVSTPLTPESIRNQLAIWRYRYAVYLGVILLLGSVLFGFAVSKMVQSRTRDLEETLEQNKKLEHAAKKDRERLIQLEKAGIVSELSSIIAHEARQPVTSLINYSDGLSLYLKYKNDPVIEEATREISRQAQRISDIVERVRSYAKRKDSVHVNTDLVALVKKVMRTVRVTEETAGVVLATRLPERAIVCCDPFEIELVIVNLTRNALQAVASLKDEVAYVEVGIRSCEDEAKWELFVRDNGPSIEPEKIKQLSRPVYSEKIEGLGLGLSICRVIAERHTTRLQFEAFNPHGLIVKLNFDNCNSKKTNESSC